MNLFSGNTINLEFLCYLFFLLHCFPLHNPSFFTILWTQIITCILYLHVIQQVSSYLYTLLSLIQYLPKNPLYEILYQISRFESRKKIYKYDEDSQAGKWKNENIIACFCYFESWTNLCTILYLGWNSLSYYNAYPEYVTKTMKTEEIHMLVDYKCHNLKHS